MSVFVLFFEEFFSLKSNIESDTRFLLANSWYPFKILGELSFCLMFSSINALKEVFSVPEASLDEG
jgi:hypothetical protein